MPFQRVGVGVDFSWVDALHALAPELHALARAVRSTTAPSAPRELAGAAS